MLPVIVCTILTKCLTSFHRDGLLQMFASACSDSAQTCNTLRISIIFIYSTSARSFIFVYDLCELRINSKLNGVFWRTARLNILRDNYIAFIWHCSLPCSLWNIFTAKYNSAPNSRFNIEASVYRIILIATRQFRNISWMYINKTL
jgi:hypothetical protein